MATTVYRLDTLESDVNIIRSDIQGVTTLIQGMAIQLDSLTKVHKSAGDRSLLPDQAPAIITPPVQPSPGAVGAVQEDTIPTPRQLRESMNKDGYIDKQLAREALKHDKVEGKNMLLNDNLADNPITKPYMFLERPGLNTLKEKLAVRITITSGEYVNALIALLMEDGAFTVEDGPHILRHLHEVSTDSMCRKWPAVRVWSQRVFDLIERKKIGWADYQLIQNERVQAAIAHYPSTSTGTPQSGTMQFPCSDFNSSRGCQHKAHHDEGPVRLMHSCAFCLGKGKSFPHTVIACNNKFTDNPFTQQSSGNRGQGQQSQGQSNPSKN